jgi:uncharacterized 2Fe-2S/4Fe-4S cluster protein (DUF4445 family)
LNTFKITVLPENKTIEVSKEKTLHLALAEAGFPIEGTCGGRGTCGKCKIKVIEGQNALSVIPSKKLSHEEIEAGWRLACLIPISEDMIVMLPPKAEEGDRKTHLSGKDYYPINIDLKKKHLVLEKPTLQDQTSDLRRIALELGIEKPQFTPQIIKKAPEVLRKAKFDVTVTYIENKLLDIEVGDTASELYGVAFDIGTTTVVGSLIDLNNGKVIAASAAANLQRGYGADVIARITYVSENNDGLDTLQKKVIETLNNIIENLVNKTGIKRENIYSIATVGNTCMQHLLVGADPTNIAGSPYIPVFQDSINLSAYQLGIETNKESVIYVSPNIAGYVGADTVGVILATELEKSDQLLLAVDIGTNGELVLGNKEKMLSCSTAAGPAFEGAQIKYGMRAADGAIEEVVIDESVNIKVIGNKKPVGICGSGLVDAVAQLVKVGIIEASGRIIAPEEAVDMPEDLVSRIVKGQNGYDFVLYRDVLGKDILLTQKDVRELQLAKGAIYAGIKILAKEFGVEIKDIGKVLLAGAFGNYINIESAKIIKLLPKELEVEQVGNAAGIGSRMIIASDEEKQRADLIAKKVRYIELSSRLDFQDEFITALNFGD